MRILLVVEHPAGQPVLTEHLREWGHDVYEVANGIDALTFLQDQDATIDMPPLEMCTQVGKPVLDAEYLHRQLSSNLQALVHQQTSVIQEAQEEVISRLFTALELRDVETSSHVRRIGHLCSTLAGLVGWQKQPVAVLKNAAALHDIGKLAIPDYVLRKPALLTPEEFEIVKQHTTIGAQILSDSNNPVIRLGEVIARSHHENWDGSGYPEGLAGEDIPIEARIVSIVDVYDALLSDRVYRRGLSEEETLAILREGSGKKFDPSLLEVFFSNLDIMRKIMHELQD